MLQTTQARVKECLDYDPETGAFRWKIKPAGRNKIGSVAGGVSSSGYWCIALDGNRFGAHRLAWLYVHGVLPPADIDHINCDRLDNRLANLRLATRSENMRNSRGLPSASGLKGAHWRAHRKPWRSSIRKDGKRLHLGCFATAEEAHAAYTKAATKLHGEFARTA
jgi:hypothetical protein